jgi:hypothetical protein
MDNAAFATDYGRFNTSQLNSVDYTIVSNRIMEESIKDNTQVSTPTIKQKGANKQDFFQDLQNIFHIFQGTTLHRTVEQSTGLISSIMQDYAELSRDVPIQCDFARTGVTSLQRYIDLGTLLRGGMLQLSYGRVTETGAKEDRTVNVKLPQRTYIESSSGNWDASRNLYRGLRVDLQLSHDTPYKILDRSLCVTVPVSLYTFMLNKTFTLEFPSMTDSTSTEVVNTAVPLYQLGQPYYIQQHSVATCIGLDSLAVTFKINESDLAKLARDRDEMVNTINSIMAMQF